jgi:hypothetical protein
LSGTVTYSSARLKSRGLTGSVFLESRSSEARVTDVFVRTSTRKNEIALDVELTGVKQAGPVQVVADLLNEKGELEDGRVRHARGLHVPARSPWV